MDNISNMLSSDCASEFINHFAPTLSLGQHKASSFLSNGSCTFEALRR